MKAEHTMNIKNRYKSASSSGRWFGAVCITMSFFLVLFSSNVEAQTMSTTNIDEVVDITTMKHGGFPRDENAKRSNNQMDLQSMTPQCRIGNCYLCSCAGRSEEPRIYWKLCSSMSHLLCYVDLISQLTSPDRLLWMQAWGLLPGRRSAVSVRCWDVQCTCE